MTSRISDSGAGKEDIKKRFVGNDQMDTQMKYNSLGVVIVNYCTYELCVRCVESIVKHNIAIQKNIVIVDNCSPDKSGERLKSTFPDVRVVLSGMNSGFGHGINLGAEILDTQLLLILNPDTYFLDDSIHKVINAFQNNNSIGVIGLELINPDGSLQYSARKFYSILDIIVRRTPLKKLPGFRLYNNSHLKIDDWKESFFPADWVMGTGFVVRKKVFDQLNGMDVSYFMYMEDVDFCVRVWLSGHQVLAAPGVKLVHDHQRNSKSGPFSKAGRIHLTSLYLFRKKYRLPLFTRPSLSTIKK